MSEGIVRFWGSGALMLVIGLSFFLPALIGRFRSAGMQRREWQLRMNRQRRQELGEEALEPGQAEAIAAEMDRALLEDLDERKIPAGGGVSASGRSTLIVALLGVTVIGVLLYEQLGRVDLLAAPPMAEAENPETLRASVEQLAAKLAKNPNDLEGWLLLGRSLQAMRNPGQAVTAYEFALKLAPEDPDVGTLYAQALAEANAGSLRGRPSEFVLGILKKHPEHPMALWLAGLAAAESGDSRQAERYWERLKVQLPPDSDEYQRVSEYLRQAKTLAGSPVATEPAATAGTAGAEARIRVKVKLAPGIAKQVSPEDSVFIFAKAAQGPAMPLAVVRRQVKDLPLEITLDDSMAMTDSRKLSSVDRVVLGARVSKTGRPMAASGDFQALSEPLPSTTKAEQIIEIRDEIP